MLDVRPEKQWLTAAEAAAEQLPEFQFSERQVQYFIRDGKLQGRKRAGRGGGREFHWTDLPAQARTEYLKRHGVAVEKAAPESRDRNLEAEARARIVEAAREFLSGRKGTIAKKLNSFCANYKNRRAGMEPWVYEAVSNIAPHRIAAWERKLRAGGTQALLDSRGRPKGTSWIEDDLGLRAFIVATVAARPHLAATAIRSAVLTDLNRDVPLRTLQAFLATLKKNNKALVKALTDPDRARSHHRPAFGSRSMNIVRVNQLWEIDASPADAMCATAEGPRRFKLTAVIDVCTRRVRVVVSDQPRGLATQALLRRAIIELGLPETLKADNGKEYRNRAVERFCRDTGIRLEFSRPFSPEEKGHIERFFGTLQRGLFELLPGYIGHDVAGRRAIENRRSFAHRFGEQAQLVMETSLTPAELQARIDTWLTDVYEQTPHGGLGMAPAAKALAHAGEEKRLENLRALDVLLFDVEDGHGIRIVGKRGVRVGNAFYVADELGAYPGRRVHVKRDPLDPSTAIIYCAASNQFICVARDADSLDGESRMRVALSAKRNFDQMVSRARRDTKAVQRLHAPDGLADRMLRLAASNDFPSSPSGTAEGPARIAKLSAIDSNVKGAGEPFTLAPESERALFDASRPALVEHARAQAAIEQSKSVPRPYEPTDEDRAGVVAFLESVSPAAPPPQLVQCDGYTRPFIEDDVEEYRWLEAHEAMLDASDRARLEECRASHSFQLLVQQHRARERALAGAAA